MFPAALLNTGQWMGLLALAIFILFADNRALAKRVKALEDRKR